ncbi:two-component system, NarL family, sensor histidine kinase DesK [Paenibacillus sp. UNCCL117]|uniref:sensor histidine kinase n=1 Tax=unclassified Paenibacillus TaxID=185978 RepID=UPI00088C766A|nr:MULTISPECIES: sensor histidine kinase [unclassified Paenibacillus]SDE46101.1 two-component system, NarL family, sensor histidine kinase DesK [Paenibacillus sp. cl123]SFW65930.1 two-component system, NarL family, sensor histidine kinase DesK [Paenibacillus sp. UNCCL117]
MQKWYHIFHRSTGLSPYVWVVFYILPFYFIFRSSSTYEVVSGIVMILAFFGCYVLSFLTKGWQMYFWTGVQVVISIAMTLLFGYVYFALFLAFFIGNIQHRVGFFTLYSIHLVTTIVAVNVGFITQKANPVFITQLPFVVVSLIAVILLPVTTYNRNKRDKLQVQLEDANKRISELVKLEERQRIARDLHDTLGQKLSLIGLKSDLAGKLIASNPERALTEIDEVRQTARSALKEVREMVTQMRGTKLEDEIFRIEQICRAAQIDFHLEGDPKLTATSLMTENVLSMCLKEAVTNVVKHSGATACTIAIDPTPTELVVRVQDNGVGVSAASEGACFRGNGLRGMKERLEFVNGSLDISCRPGMTLVMKVPNVFRPMEKEAEI